MKTVLVTKKSITDRHGIAKLTSAKPKVYGIKARYMTGEVQTTSGDVWNVKPYSGSEADYITVSPAED